MSPPMKKHLELEIKTLENAPRDAEKLERLLKTKRRQKEEAMLMEDTQRLVTEEIEIFRNRIVVLLPYHSFTSETFFKIVIILPFYLHEAQGPPHYRISVARLVWVSEFRKFK